MMLLHAMNDRMIAVSTEDPDADVAEMAEALVVGFSLLASPVENPEGLISQDGAGPVMVQTATAVQARERIDAGRTRDEALASGKKTAQRDIEIARQRYHEHLKGLQNDQDLRQRMGCPQGHARGGRCHEDAGRPHDANRGQGAILEGYTA